jgi:hypothetical protein
MNKQKLAEQYAENKSSSDIFIKAHEKDFIAGWEACLSFFPANKFSKSTIGTEEVLTVNLNDNDLKLWNKLRKDK